MNNLVKTLKALSAINNGIVLKAGKPVHTISPERHIYACSNEIAPFDFGIYDLGQFLSTLSLTNDDSREITVDGVQMVIKDDTVTLRYTGAVESQIVTPPEDVTPLTSLEKYNKFNLPKDELKRLIQAGVIMLANDFVFEYKNNFVNVSTKSDNPDANVFSKEFPCEVTKEEVATLSADMLKVLDQNDYTVYLTEKSFVFESDDITYYLVRSDI